MSVKYIYAKIVLEDVPFHGRQHYNGKIAPSKVLFMQKRLIAGEKNLDAVFFGCTQ